MIVSYFYNPKAYLCCTLALPIKYTSFEPACMFPHYALLPAYLVLSWELFSDGAEASSKRLEHPALRRQPLCDDSDLCTLAKSSRIFPKRK